MKRGVLNHPKFRRLVKRLGLPSFQVAGVLESMWQFAGEYAEDGDLSAYDVGDMADMWGTSEEQAAAFVEALVAERWLDRVPNGLCIHDWLDHLPEYLVERARKRKQRKHLQDEQAGMSRDIPGASQKNLPDLPGLALPDLAKPSKPQPVSGRVTGMAGEAESVAHAMRQARAGANGGLDAWVAKDAGQAAAITRALRREGKSVPVILGAWDGFLASDYWRKAGWPLPKFQEHFAKFAVGRASPRPYPERDLEPCSVCGCGKGWHFTDPNNPGICGGDCAHGGHEYAA